MDCLVHIGVYISAAAKYFRQNTNTTKEDQTIFFDVGNCKQLKTMDWTGQGRMVISESFIAVFFSSKISGQKLNI